MGKHISFPVLESSSELRLMIRKESNSKNILRLQSLLHIKEKTFKKQTDLATHLGYNVRSMELWLKVYKDEGIESMQIGLKPRKAKKRKISKEVYDGLSDKLNDSFGSYVYAVEWVKQPRKSHIKKDPEAQTDFLKLT